MKIHGHSWWQRLQGVFLKRWDRGETRPSGRSFILRDKTQLSPEAQLLLKAKKHLSSVEDIRWDKVEAIRQALKEGDYHISVEELAEALLKEMKR